MFALSHACTLADRILASDRRLEFREEMYSGSGTICRFGEDGEDVNEERRARNRLSRVLEPSVSSDASEKTCGTSCAVIG